MKFSCLAGMCIRSFPLYLQHGASQKGVGRPRENYSLNPWSQKPSDIITDGSDTLKEFSSIWDRCIQKVIIDGLYFLILTPLLLTCVSMGHSVAACPVPDGRPMRFVCCLVAVQQPPSHGIHAEGSCIALMGA